MTLEQALDRCQAALDELKEEVFDADMRLTLVIRHPSDEDCNLIVTADDLERVEALIRRRREEKSA